MHSYYKRAKKLKLLIEESYRSLRVNIKITDIRYVPRLLRYIFRIKLLPGTKLQTIFTRAEDVQVTLGFPLFYPYREETAVYIAVSEVDIKENKLLTILRNPAFSNSQMQIPLALGYDLSGNMCAADLSRLFHLLVVGPSGTGKSTALQSIVLSIIVNRSTEAVRLLLFDIGGNSLSMFENVVHLYHPIVKDTTTGVSVLKSLVAEIDERISLGEDNCKNLPYIVALIDEYDDTISSIQNKEQKDIFISGINSIIRRGRKAKVILILASHTPTQTNTKVNINEIIPRIVFQCSKTQGSLNALGVPGAENLRGKGSMLFKSQDIASLPLQGAYVTKSEIERILENVPTGCEDLDMLKIKEPEPLEFVSSVPAEPKNDTSELAQIIYWVLGQTKISGRAIQQKFRIGNRVSDILDTLCCMAIIGEKDFNQPRNVLPKSIEDLSPEALNIRDREKFCVKAE